MLKDKNMQLSIYSLLYDNIPENHTLKLIKDALDFSFVNKLLEDSYCKNFGRPAKEPELMVKLLVLQYLYNLSDVRVIEDASLNLAYMYFLDINPDEKLPHPSLLAKFRVHRLQDVSLDEIITEIVRQCVSKGIIKDNGISIDATHTEANTSKVFPEKVVKRMAKKMFTTLQEEVGEVPSTVNQDIPDYKEIEDHKEARVTMKTYLEDTIKEVEENVQLENTPKTKAIIDTAKTVLNDPKFIELRGVRSHVDIDARIGYKSRTDYFFGYKTEYMITTDERIITAVQVHNGAYSDGAQFSDLLNMSKKSGLSIKEVYGDKAYFKKPILDEIKSIGAKPYIPISAGTYKIDEERFSYNKDSDQWFCEQGNYTTRKKLNKRDNGKRLSYKYYFEREQCKQCPLRESCIKGRTVGKIMEISINTPDYYAYSQEQKTEEFKEKYKNRSCQEWKNGEMKNFHGLDRARGYGLKSMSKQAKLTALAVNLKRIANILSSQQTSKINFFINFRRKIHVSFNFPKIIA